VNGRGARLRQGGTGFLFFPFAASERPFFHPRWILFSWLQKSEPRFSGAKFYKPGREPRVGVIDKGEHLALDETAIRSAFLVFAFDAGKELRERQAEGVGEGDDQF